MTKKELFSYFVIKAQRDSFMHQKSLLSTEINYFGRDVFVFSEEEGDGLGSRFISFARTCANKPDPPRTNKFDTHQSVVLLYKKNTHHLFFK